MQIHTDHIQLNHGPFNFSQQVKYMQTSQKLRVETIDKVLPTFVNQIPNTGTNLETYKIRLGTPLLLGQTKFIVLLQELMIFSLLSHHLLGQVGSLSFLSGSPRGPPFLPQPSRQPCPSACARCSWLFFCSLVTILVVYLWCALS